MPHSDRDTEDASGFAAKLSLPLLAVGTDLRHCHDFSAIVIVEQWQLALQLTGKGAPGPVIIDFGDAAMRHRRKAGQNELLGRAVGVGRKSPLAVLDTTAGLGRDSFVLADLGCTVSLCERDPVIGEMLGRAIDAAVASADSWLTGVASRMRLLRGDARDTEVQALGPVDVIYLDPMFPERSKSAAVKKDMALFQLVLHGSPNTDDELLEWALAQDVARVVVKRPARAPTLGGLAPSHEIKGKAVRYDVYVLRGLQPKDESQGGD